MKPYRIETSKHPEKGDRPWRGQAQVLLFPDSANSTWVWAPPIFAETEQAAASGALECAFEELEGTMQMLSEAEEFTVEDTA